MERQNQYDNTILIPTFGKPFTRSGAAAAGVGVGGGPAACARGVVCATAAAASGSVYGAVALLSDRLPGGQRRLERAAELPPALTQRRREPQTRRRAEAAPGRRQRARAAAPPRPPWCPHRIRGGRPATRTYYPQPPTLPTTCKLGEADSYYYHNHLY